MRIDRFVDSEISPGRNLDGEENSKFVRNLIKLVVEASRNDRAAKPMA
jgi:hypothetical protein